MSTGIRNNKALIFLVIILLLSNIGLLFYFLSWKKPPGRGWGGRKGESSIVDFMKKEIGFTEDQSVQYKALHELNRDSLKILGENIRKSKTELYGLVQKNMATDSSVQNTAEQIALLQKKIELTMFYHFQKVRALCNTEQKVKLDSLVTRMNNRPPWFRRGGPGSSEKKGGKD